MKDIITIMKANIKHGKSGFFSVLMLMFIISMTLTAVITVSTNSTKRDKEALEHAGFGEFFGAFSEKKLEANNLTIEELTDRVEQSSVVKKVETTDCVFAQLKDLNGHDSGSNIIVERYNPEMFDFEFYGEDNSSFLKEKITLNDGEICVPIAYQSMYDCEIGDTMIFKTPDGEISYKIRYFFEDPFMGGSMMGIKTVLVNDAELSALEGLCTEEQEIIGKGYLMNLFQSDKNLSHMKFEKKLNEETNFTGYAWITLATSQSIGYILILTKVFCGILLAFVILLFFVILIVVGHSISSSIELEYVNLGILKAVGVSNGRLKKILLLQYLSAAVIGMIVGIPVAIPIISSVNKMTIPVTGLCVSNQVPFLLCIPIMFGILLFIATFIVIKLRKISAITPIRAISGGRESIYFANPLEMKIKKKGLNFRLAFRQLTSNLKQYVSVCLITALLAFFLIMVNGMVNWIGEDGENLSTVFNCFEADMDMGVSDPELKDEVDALIEKTAGIETSYQIFSSYLMLDGYQIYCFVCEDPEEYTSVYKGRTCKYDNEILVTEFVAKDLGIGLGDTVTVSSGENKKEFIISGIYQSANDMGSNFAMNREAYVGLTGDDLSNAKNTRYAYRLSDRSKTEEVIRVVSETYEKDSVWIEKFDTFSEMDSIITAVRGISIIIYMIAVLFVLITIHMVCGKIFAREIRDLSIYKAIGVTNKRLKHQFALRFGIVAIAGSILGSLICIFTSDSLMGFMFSFMGVSQFESTSTLIEYLIPTVFMAVVYMIFSGLIFGKKMRGRDLTIKN